MTRFQTDFSYNVHCIRFECCASHSIRSSSFVVSAWIWAYTVAYWHTSHGFGNIIRITISPTQLFKMSGRLVTFAVLSSLLWTFSVGFDSVIFYCIYHQVFMTNVFGLNCQCIHAWGKEIFVVFVYLWFWHFCYTFLYTSFSSPEVSAPGADSTENNSIARAGGLSSSQALKQQLK